MNERIFDVRWMVSLIVTKRNQSQTNYPQTLRVKWLLLCYNVQFVYIYGRSLFIIFQLIEGASLNFSLKLFKVSFSNRHKKNWYNLLFFIVKSVDRNRKCCNEVEQCLVELADDPDNDTIVIDSSPRTRHDFKLLESKIRKWKENKVRWMSPSLAIYRNEDKTKMFCSSPFIWYLVDLI